MTTMTEEAFNEQQPKPANGTKTDKGTKKGNGKARQTDEALGTATGERLETLAKQAGKLDGASELSGLAAQLAKGTITHAGLVKLRDAINQVSAALREAKKNVLARQFSAANRAVRRLERAGRKAAKK